MNDDSITLIRIIIEGSMQIVTYLTPIKLGLLIRKLGWNSCAGAKSYTAKITV